MKNSLTAGSWIGSSYPISVTIILPGQNMAIGGRKQTKPITHRYISNCKVGILNCDS